MYKVLLVDDEILIRESISKRIHWKELGYELAGICENGREAIELIRERPVDLILTDICMPYVDGLALAKYVYENARSTKVVIITGYDEFEYAKKAVEYHVFSYVLKPVTSAELSQKLREVCRILEDEQSSQQVRSRYESSYPLLKNQFLLQLAQGKVAEETIGEKLREFRIDFRGGWYCAAIFYPRDPVNRMELEHMAELAGAGAPEDLLAFEGNDGAMAVYIKGDGTRERRERLLEICGGIVERIYDRLGIEVFCLLGACVMTLNGMNHSYEKALELKEYIYLEKASRIYEWDQYRRSRLMADRDLRAGDREKRLVLAVQSNLREDVEQGVRSVREECSPKWFTKAKAVLLYQSMILALMTSFERLNMEDQALFSQEQEVMSGLYGCRYISEMEEKTLELFLRAVDVMNGNRSSYGEQQAVIALRYIDEHFSESSLSLQEMCDKLAISVSYFSSAFKNYSGMTFVEALTKKRMEAAGELLKNTSLKTYEVAERCGYGDANYFSSIFKKASGKSPREYAKSVKGRKGNHEEKDKI